MAKVSEAVPNNINDIDCRSAPLFIYSDVTQQLKNKVGCYKNVVGNCHVHDSPSEGCL